MTHISTLLICILNVSVHQGAGHTRHNKIWNECIREEAGIAPVIEKMTNVIWARDYL